MIDTAIAFLWPDSAMDAALLDDDIELDLHHDRYWLAGHSGATVIDSLIIKWEFVAAIDKAYNTGDADAGLSPDAVLVTLKGRVDRFVIRQEVYVTPPDV